MAEQLELTILMPRLDEAETLAICIAKAHTFLQAAGINGEVLIADNGSADGSREIAVAAGAIVVPVEQRGSGWRHRSRARSLHYHGRRGR